jgi:CDP-diacylglycerol--glycerol-3-phosphate 3-phosphatidyltransferase
MVTTTDLVLSGATALIIAQGNMFVGGVLIVFAGIFDMFDGALARMCNKATHFSAFLDSTLERYTENIILFGLLIFALQHPGPQDSLWPAHNEQTWMIIFIFLAVVGSLMVSYTKARREAMDRVPGWLARSSRTCHSFGYWTLISNRYLGIGTVLSHVTALERISPVRRTL